MFSKILGNKENKASQEESENAEIKAKISTMNLTEMRSYLNNNIKDTYVTTYGLNEVLKKLTLRSDDMDSKKKKAFDLVIGSMKNPQMTLETLDLVRNFIETYADMINEYDTKNKEIYASRFNDAIKMGIQTLEHLLHMSNKKNILAD